MRREFFVIYKSWSYFTSSEMFSIHQKNIFPFGKLILRHPEIKSLYSLGDQIQMSPRSAQTSCPPNNASANLVKSVGVDTIGLAPIGTVQSVSFSTAQEPNDYLVILVSI